MINLFVKKTTKFKITCKGFKRDFRVVTADGKEFTATREDYITDDYYVGNGVFGYRLRSIKAKDMLACEDGFQVNEGTDIRVKPIVVELLKREEITIEETEEVNWYVFEPKQPKKYVPDTMKFEVIK